MVDRPRDFQRQIELRNRWDGFSAMSILSPFAFYRNESCSTHDSHCREVWFGLHTRVVVWLMLAAPICRRSLAVMTTNCVSLRNSMLHVWPLPKRKMSMLFALHRCRNFWLLALNLRVPKPACSCNRMFAMFRLVVTSWKNIYAIFCS